MKLFSLKELSDFSGINYHTLRYRAQAKDMILEQRGKAFVSQDNAVILIYPTNGGRKPTSGQSGSWLYCRWQNMKRIGAVPEWNDFETFLKDVGAPRSREYRLTRHDKSLPFGPTNCEWKGK